MVNNDPNSLQYKKWISLVLDSKNYQQVLIPPNFGNGHLVLSNSAIFHYKQTTFYGENKQFTIGWKNKEYNFKWLRKKVILSKRDSLCE